MRRQRDPLGSNRHFLHRVSFKAGSANVDLNVSSWDYDHDQSVTASERTAIH